jgi:TatA/E family protein of Tat protein translocase
MFGPLGVPELLFILGLALLIFGPRKLPEIGRTLGKGMAEFRKASNELKRTLNAEAIREEIRQNDPRRILREAVEESAKDDEAKPAAKSAEPAAVLPPGSPGGAAEKPEPPAGTVSRASGDASGAPAAGAPAGDEAETSAEAAADSRSSSPT